MSQQDLMMCPEGDVFTKKEVYSIWIGQRKKLFKKEFTVYLTFKGADRPEWIWNTKTLEEAKKIRDALIVDLVPDLVKKS